MEPKTQVEIQLGHMCNNRCVFCVSGQETGLGRALPLATAPILERLDEAFATGQRKLTLLGGEPTLQPGFLDVVRHAVRLGFQEIVIFTNGVKTARESFIEEVIATGGNFTWRISIQGATKESHERTTRRAGSFDRIVRSMGHLRRLGQRITVNMCVVGSNFESIEHFPHLLGEHEVSQLHLDMVRPSDAGQRTEDEFRDMLVRYTDMVPALTKLAAGVAPGFDLNVGNLPYCVAPELAGWIHHDGETTYTVAVDGDNKLSRPWDKYFVKRQDKSKPDSCRACVFDKRCNGIFEKYRELHGYSEFVPVTRERLLALDPQRTLLALHLVSRLGFLQERRAPAPFDGISVTERGDREVHVSLLGGERLTLSLGEPGGGAASFDAFGVVVLELPNDRVRAKAGLAWLWSALKELGHPVWHPLADDAVSGEARPALANRLGRLRRGAPYGKLSWNALSLSNGGRRAELALATPEGARATFWLEERRTKVTAGYDVGTAPPSDELIDGIRAILSALTDGASNTGASAPGSVPSHERGTAPGAHT
jgi:MoaA/NifB/PqqE/SkfB family radical SAM enzyme